MQKVLFAIIISSFLFQPIEENVSKPVIVLELFTSQGCSSCPPADALLSEIESKYTNKDVIALSYHVDYWNYIGWKDPFSKKAFSDKQRAYGRKFNSSTIYTPQVVFNGKEHVVGSKKTIVNSRLQHYLKKTSENTLTISNIEKKEDLISLNYTVEGTVNHKILRVILTINERETAVKRGENRNRILKNTNIVVKEELLNLEDSEGSVKLSIPDLVNKDDNLSVAVLVQTKDLDITGGRQISL